MSDTSLKNLQKVVQTTNTTLKGQAPGSNEFGQAAAQLHQVQVALKAARLALIGVGRPTGNKGPGFTL